MYVGGSLLVSFNIDNRSVGIGQPTSCLLGGNSATYLFTFHTIRPPIINSNYDLIYLSMTTLTIRISQLVKPIYLLVAEVKLT